MTLCRQWAWKPNDQIKSFDEVIKILVETVTGDGNLLLNVGPTPEGEIEPRQAERLRQLGAWLHFNGESVYGTRGGPYMNGSWGGATCKGKSVYLHLLDWKGDELHLPPLPAKVRLARCMTGGEVEVRQSPEELVFKIKTSRSLPVDTIVKLYLDRTALDIPPIPVPAK